MSLAVACGSDEAGVDVVSELVLAALGSTDDSALAGWRSLEMRACLAASDTGACNAVDGIAVYKW